MERTVRSRNQLSTNLPQLQNLIKREPPAYKDEVGLKLDLDYALAYVREFFSKLLCSIRTYACRKVYVRAHCA